MAVLDALQVFGQRLAVRLARRCLRGLGRLGRAALQFRQLGLQAGLVLYQRVLEQGALLGRHGLGLGAELPALQAREFEVDRLQLGVTPGDLSILRLDPLQQARNQRSGLGWQLRQVDAGGNKLAEHACCTSQHTLCIGECDVNGSGRGSSSTARDGAEFAQVLPRQADREGFELLHGER